MLVRKDGKLFCKKRVMVKAHISPSISEETVLRVLQKTDLKWIYFQRKGILTKNDLKLGLKLLENSLVSVQCETIKYEIIKKSVVLHRVEVNLLKSAHYY